MAAFAAMTAIEMFMAASSVASIALSLTSMMQGKPSFEQNDGGSKISRKGSDNPIIVPFGRSQVPAVQVWNKVDPSDTKWLSEVHSLGRGPLKSILNVYIDDQPLFTGGSDLSEQWLTPSENNFGNVKVGTRRGNYTNSPWQQMISRSGGEWTTAMRGDGIANLSFQVERPAPSNGDVSTRVMSDNFQASALVEGIPVVDPRFDTRLLGATDPKQRKWMNGNVESYRNPAVCLFTYVLDQEWGFKFTPDMINIQSFIYLANWCDANQITLDGFIDQGQTYGEILNDFATSWGGSIYTQGGKLCVRAESVSPVRHNIKEEDLVGGVVLSNNKSSYFNTVKIDFNNKDTNYAKDSFVLPKDATKDATIREDGRVIDKSIDCPLTVSPSYVKILANRELKRAKLCQKELSISVCNLDYPMELGDVITVTNSHYSLDTSTKWRVIQLDNTLDDKTLVTKVSCQQYDSKIYDQTTYDDGNLSRPQDKPDFTILPVSGLKFVQNTSHDIGSGTLSWNSNYYSDRRFVVQYRLTGTTIWTSYGEYPDESVNMVNLQTGKAYDFRVRVIASIGGSTWATITNQQINRSIVLPAVTNLKCEFTSPSGIITFDPINSPITNNSVVGDGYTNLSQLVAYYQVTVNTKTYRTTTPRFEYTFEMNSVNGLTRDLAIQVEAVSIHGDLGTVARTTARNEPMGQPASVEVHSQMVSLTVSWLNPSDMVADYSATDIWITETNVAPKPADLVASSDVGFWTAVRANAGIKKWVWCAHRDVFGHPTIPVYSAPIYFEETSIDDLIDKSEFNQNFEALEKQVDDNKVLQDKIRVDVDKNRADADAAFKKNDTDIAKAKDDIIKNATDIQTANSKISSNTALIEENKQAISGVAGDMATMETRLQAGIDGNKANITKNATAISTTDRNLAEFKTSTGTEFTSVKKDINDKNVATNGRIDSVETSVSDVNGNVTTLGKKVDSNYTDLNNKNTVTNARIDTQATAITEQGKALTTLDQKLTARINTNAAGIETNRLAIVDDKKALADYKISVNTEFGKTNGRIDTVATSVSTLEGSVSNLTTEVRANKTSQDGLNKSMDAAIKTNATAIVDTNKAVATLDTKLSAKIGDVEASVQTISNAQVATDGKVSAMYGLKVSAGGKVAGITLGANDKYSSMDVLADRFKIAQNDADGTPVTAFEVRGGKVMVRNLLVGDLVGTQIRAGSITGQEISATSLIRVGSGQTSATLSGSDQNWRFWCGSTDAAIAPIRFDSWGNAYFQNGTFNGTVNASSGTFNGTVNAVGGNFTGYVQVGNSYMSANPAHDFLNGNGGNFRVDRNGSLFANNGDFRGTIYADKIVGDVTRTGLKQYPTNIGININQNEQYVLFQANLPAASFNQTFVLSKLPFEWSHSESGGANGQLWIRLSNGMNRLLGNARAPGTFSSFVWDDPNVLSNISQWVPAGVTWLQIYLTSSRKTKVARAFADEGMWQAFKDGSGGITVSGF